jgi:hypothetical protein
MLGQPQPDAMEKQQSIREAPSRKETTEVQQHPRPRSGVGAASALKALRQLEQSYEWASRDTEDGRAASEPN